MKDLPEEDIQKTIATELDYNNVVWFHVANERDVPVKRLSKLKSQGMKSGVPDCIICTLADNGKPSALELKKIGNRPTNNQAEWLGKLAQEGWNTAYTAGLEEARQQLRDWNYID
jgi:hypothetical protein